MRQCAGLTDQIPHGILFLHKPETMKDHSFFFCIKTASVFLLAVFSCDNFNILVKEEIDYNLSVTPVYSWEELKTAIETGVPDGGSGVFTIMSGFPAASTITITNNKTITIEAYRSAHREAVIFRASGFTAGALFAVTSGSLILGAPRGKGTLILDGGAVWDADHNNTGLDSSAPLVTSNGNLTLNDRAVLRNNHNISGNGGGIAAAGTFTMNGGIISGNSVSAAGADGGGVYVYPEESAFIKSGGIRACSGRLYRRVKSILFFS
jgi:hypothetical protein